MSRVNRVISIIEDQEVIDKILGHLSLCQKNQRPPPRPKSLEPQIDYSESQLPFYEEAFDQDFGTSADHSTVGKVQTHKVPFSSDDPLISLPLALFFSLTVSFSFLMLFQ